MTTEGLKQKLTAILSADVKDYSRLLSQDRVSTINMLKSHRELFSDFIRQYGGRIIDTPGDNILAVIESVSDAVNCAAEIQRELAERNAEVPSTRMMQWRIGVNLGDVVEEDDRIYGDGVNIAARVENICEPGGICISGTVYDQVQDKLGLEYESLGEQEVKNITNPVRVYRVLSYPGAAAHRVPKAKANLKKTWRNGALIAIAIIAVGIGSVLIWNYIFQRDVPPTEVVVNEKSVAPAEKPSIIVVPFANLSPDPEQDYFSDGLTDEIITDLSQTGKMLVISAGTAMTFKGTKKKNSDIAREVNVQYVLEGSVRKAGNDLRITAQLIDAENDAHLWAEKYSGTLDDIFDIQEKVSRSIVDALKIKLSSKENAKLTDRPIKNLQAYEYYLKASSEIFKYTEEAINHALLYIQSAINVIGDNDLLYSSMAYAYFNLTNIGAKQEDYVAKAEDYVQKALMLNPRSSKAYSVLSQIDLLKGRISSSLFNAKKALDIYPDDTYALLAVLSIYLVSGKISESNYFLERWIRIDPIDFVANLFKAMISYYDGDIRLSLQHWRELYKMYPENPMGLFYYSLVLACNNEMDEAISIIDQSNITNPGTMLSKLGTMLKYAIKGNREKIIQEITPDFTKTVKRDPYYSQPLADIYALIDDKKKALDWLENAVNVGFINYPFLNEYDPLLESIRGEERFKKLMERVRYEWENFEVE